MPLYCISIRSLCWIFAEDKGHETPEFRRTLIHLEILRDDLGQLIFVLDLERVLASVQLMSQSAYCPCVNLLVVVLSAEDFR
jgi:hypothetical protein